MRFSVERDAFADATGWAARHLPNRPGPARNVLTGILLAAGHGSPASPGSAAVPLPSGSAASPGSAAPLGAATASVLTICAYDTEVAVRAPVAASVDEPGRVLVPGRLLTDIVRSLPATTVDVVVDGDRLVLRCGSVRFTVPLMDPGEYPQLPSFPGPIGEVDTLGFASAVGQVAPAAGRDETMPVLTAVRMEISGRGLALVATDRYRLAVRGIPWQPTVDDPWALAHVPAKVLAEVARTPTSASRIVIGLDLDDPSGARLGLAAGGRQTIVRLIEGTFPNYRKLLPEAAALVVTAQTAALAAAVRRVAVVATRTGPLRFTFTHNQVVAEAGDGGGAQASETIPVEYAGPELSVLFNPSYLLDGLGAVEDDQATIGFVDDDPVEAAAKPAVLTGKDSGRGAVDEGAYRYLLMPIRHGGG
ncbi:MULTISPECIES: DNA polymerase III subunit beta [unclassified Frankia]|uniref:DNA polymerase III subunit beta n=1 Tax=unclassified Frankia TaxID=2632575 RepID=UPI00040C509B|nr:MULTISPECIES: DNA polymerase III subunit beta [unclassified Frankia]ORT55839.1 DNA polymerase III subunit beta [Frankia sp. KB5]